MQCHPDKGGDKEDFQEMGTCSTWDFWWRFSGVPVWLAWMLIYDDTCMGHLPDMLGKLLGACTYPRHLGFSLAHFHSLGRFLGKSSLFWPRRSWQTPMKRSWSSAVEVMIKVTRCAFFVSDMMGWWVASRMVFKGFQVILCALNEHQRKDDSVCFELVDFLFCVRFGKLRHILCHLVLKDSGTQHPSILKFFVQLPGQALLREWHRGEMG